MTATFPERLTTAMALRGVSKTALDGMAGLAKGAGGRYASGKRGKRPSAEIVARIARALHVSAEWLATGEGEMQAPDEAPRDDHPHRVPVYGSDAYRDASPQVQAWFTSRRLASDLTTEQWASALRAASVLHELGLLYGPRPRKSP